MKTHSKQQYKKQPNKTKITTILIIILIINLTLLTTAQKNIEKNIENPEIQKIKTNKINIFPTEKLPTKITSSKNLLQNISKNRNIIPKETYPTQKNPKIITDNQNILILLETKNNKTNNSQISATYSQDQGNNWNEILTVFDNYTEFKTPTIDYTGDPEMQAYGSHKIDTNTGVQSIFNFPSLSDPYAIYTGSTTDFDRYGWFTGLVLNWNPDDWLNITDLSTAGYKHGTSISPYENFHGLTAWSGQHIDLGWSYYLICETDEHLENTYKILWKGDLNQTIYNISMDIDLSNGWQYDSWEIKNKTTNNHETILDMLLIEPGNPTWFNNKENYGPSHVFKNYTNPSIKASNGYVYLVCEKQGDIYLHYSSDEGYNFQTKQITNTIIKESQPDVTAIGTIVTISYIQNNDLYIIKSQDAGETWDEPMRINDETNKVSNNPYSTDIDKNYAVFTNTEKPPTILFSTLNITIPQLTIENISIGISISADIKNIGTVNITNLNISAKFTDGLILNRYHYIISNYTLKPNEIINLEIFPIIGFGKTTFTILIQSDNIETTEIKIAMFILFFYAFIQTI
jgi:hypothetical protein